MKSKAKQQYLGYQKGFNQYFTQLISSCLMPSARLKQAIEYSTLSSGKRIRPILVYLTGELLNIAPPVLNVIGAAIEMIHCYSLIHDDLPALDDDDLRRGQPSCHRAYDEATAILAGDALQALAFEHLTQLIQHIPAQQTVAVITEFSHAIGPLGMVGGQSLDLSLLCKDKISQEQLSQIQQLKTGKLIAAAINCVILSHTNQTHIPAIEPYTNLQHYARNLGLAFQIQDDYLDKYGTKQQLGKERGSDEANNKVTFAHFYSKPNLEALFQHHYHLALKALTPFNHQADTLIEFTQDLMHRATLTQEQFSPA